MGYFLISDLIWKTRVLLILNLRQKQIKRMDGFSCNINRRAAGSKLFETLIAFLKDVLKVNCEKNERHFLNYPTFKMLNNYINLRIHKK